MNKWKSIFAALLISYLSIVLISCSTTGVSPTNYSRLQVINTLTGSTPIIFTLNSTQIYKSTITFPASSGYVSVTPGANFINYITYSSSLTLPTSDTSQKYQNFIADSSYSIFLTGTTSNYSILKINDVLTNPANTRAKIRFVNVAPSVGALDITINGTSVFTNIGSKGIGAFIEVPAGTYEFKAMNTGVTGTTLATLSNQVLADGKIYTLYAYGITTSTATNAAFGLAVISNLLPATK